jgi:hypothetical protein
MYLVLCWLVLPGKSVDGTVLRDGTRLSYKINGQPPLAAPLNPNAIVWDLLKSSAQKKKSCPFSTPAFNSLICTILLTAAVFARWGDSPFLYIVDHYVELITASLIMSISQAVYCYGSSFQPGRILALGGNSGNVIYDVSLYHIWQSMIEWQLEWLILWVSISGS